SHAFHRSLTSKIVGPALGPMILVAVEFDGEATIVAALDDQIERKRTHLHLWLDAVAQIEQAGEHIALEPRLAQRHEVPSWLRPPLHRVLEVSKNLRLEVIGLQHVLGDGSKEVFPVASARQGDVKALLKGECGLRRSRSRALHHAQEHDVAFLALEYGGVATRHVVAQV